MSAIGSCSATGNETFSLSVGEAGGVDLDEVDAGRGEPGPRLRHRPRRPARSSPAQNDAGMPMRRPVSDAGEAGAPPVIDRVEQGNVGDGAAHRPDRVARVADRHHAGAVVAALRAAVADRRAQADDAAQRGRDARRAAGVGAEPARHDARGDGRGGAAGRAARDARPVVGVLHRPGEAR